MLSPEAKCPDCILAARQARDREKLETKGAGAPPAGRLDAIARTADEARARDAAVLDLLQHGPATFERLVSVMPGHFEGEGATVACRRTLDRLLMRKIVKIAPEGYARV